MTILLSQNIVKVGMNEDLSKYKRLFIQTAKEYITKLSNSLYKLQVDKNDSEEINTALIASHSLKGQALAMGYEKTGKLAFSLEAKLRKTKDENIIKEADVKNLLEGAMLIKECIEAIEAGKEEPEVDEIAGKLAYEENINC